MPVNPKQYIDKLIKALEIHKRYYNISTRRFYSEKTGRYCTKYVLEDCQDKGFRLEVYNKIEILKYLVREFSMVTGQAVPEACLEPLDDKEPEPESNEKKETRGRPKKRTGLDVLNNFKAYGGKVSRPYVPKKKKKKK